MVIPNDDRLIGNCSPRMLHEEGMQFWKWARLSECHGASSLEENGSIVAFCRWSRRYREDGGIHLNGTWKASHITDRGVPQKLLESVLKSTGADTVSVYTTSQQGYDWILRMKNIYKYIHWIHTDVMDFETFG